MRPQAAAFALAAHAAAPRCGTLDATAAPAAAGYDWRRRTAAYKEDQQ